MVTSKIALIQSSTTILRRKMKSVLPSQNTAVEYKTTQSFDSRNEKFTIAVY